MWLGAAKLWFLVSSYAITIALTHLLTADVYGSYYAIARLVAVPNMVIIYTVLFSVSRPLAAQYDQGCPDFAGIRARGLRLALVLGVPACAVVLLAAPWLSYLLQGLWLRLHGALPVAAGPPPPPADLLPPEPAVSFFTPLFFPFLGGVQLSGLGLHYFVGEDFWVGRELLWLPMVFSAVAHGLLWLGLCIAVQRVRSAWRAGALIGRDLHLALICVLTFAVQAVLHIVLRRHTHPHYYNGSWICLVYFVALALSSDAPWPWPKRLWRPGLRIAVGLGLALSLSLVTSDLALRLHATSGTRGLHFGATLGNQIEVARSLARYHPDSPLSVEVLNYRLFPHALSLLRPLCGVPSDPAAPRQPLRLRYRSADPRDGGILVEPMRTP